MGRRCLLGCSLPKPLFPFPKTPWLRARWLEFVHFEESGLVENSRLCSRHFTPDCFRNLIQHQMGFTDTLLLTNTAIPTVYTVGASPCQKPMTREVGCQCDSPTTKTAAVQAVRPTPKPKRRSKAIQVKPLGRYGRISTEDSFEPTTEPLFSSIPAKRPCMEELNENFSTGRSLLDRSCPASRVQWTSDESSDSASERKDYASDEDVDGRPCGWKGQTAPMEIELELTKSMINKPSAALQEDRKDFLMSSFTPDEEENLSESSYVNLNKEVLVLLLFRCLECSGECRVRGKGKGGNLSLQQECLICCNYRVWTAQPAQMPKEKVADMHLTSVGSLEMGHENNHLKRMCQDRAYTSRGQEEADAEGEVSSFVVKEEVEDDYEKEAGSLLMKTYEDNVPISSIGGKDNVGLNTALAKEEPTEPFHITSTLLTHQNEGFSVEDDRRKLAEKACDQSSEEKQQDASEESLSSLYEPDSSEEEFSEEDLNTRHLKPFQNTIKPIDWCEDCEAVADVFCVVRRHQRIYGCADCGLGDGAESCSFKEFSVHFSDIQSFHKHAMEVHGMTENLHECSICQDCNKMARLQTDSNKKGHVCEHKVKPFACCLCDKHFVTEIGQKVHYRRLHGDYMQLCKYCMMVFTTKTSKLAHEQTHSKEELPYICPDCPEKFKDFVARNQHLESHRGQSKYVCNVCDQKFASLQRYERHMCIHSGEKPYRCEVCERSFNQAGHLKSHMRLHTGEKPFMREQCGECFNHNVSLKNHLLRQHDTDSTSVEEDDHESRSMKNFSSSPADEGQCRKKARNSSSSLDAAEDPEKVEEKEWCNPDYREESQASDSDGEEHERGCKKKARNKKGKKRQNCTDDEQ